MLSLKCQPINSFGSEPRCYVTLNLFRVYRFRGDTHMRDSVTGHRNSGQSSKTMMSVSLIMVINKCFNLLISVITVIETYKVQYSS